MAEFILSQKQLELINDEVTKLENYRLAEENWNKFSKDQKENIVEMLKVIYPEKSKLIKEGNWLNTLGDVVGIFDPTGVVDLVNGLSYIYQGDYLFGFLSLVSVVPYAGDVVAKPVMAALKIGKPSAKALKEVMAIAKAGDTVTAARKLNALTESGGLVGTFVKGFSKIAGKLRGYLERVPMPMFKGLKKTILQWFDLFENAAKVGKPLRAQGQNIVKGMTGQRFGNVVVKWNKATQIKKLEELIKATKDTKGLFTGYRTTKGFFSWKTVFGGMPQLIGRNKSVRALMRQTKWWLGFLDWLNVANFVGPDELAEKMGEGEMIKQMEAYNKTDGAQQNFQQDFGEAINQEGGGTTSGNKWQYGKVSNLFGGGGSQAPQTSTAQAPKTDDNPIKGMFQKMFFGEVNPLPVG